MSLTEDKFADYKADYTVMGTESVMDEYRNEQRVPVAKGTIHVMWHPITDEASIAAYGDKISSMLECILYEGDVAEFDRIEIGGDTYEAVSVKRYNTHRVVQVRRVV